MYSTVWLGNTTVTGLRCGVLYEVEEIFPADGSHVPSDLSIRFTGRWACRGFAGKLRLVRYYSSEKNRVLCFVTNNFAPDPATVALLYKYRWQIDLFFKWIKQPRGKEMVETVLWEEF